MTRRNYSAYVLLWAAAACGGLLISSSANAENTKVVRDRIARDIQYLASDELEGRGVGTKGIDLAAEYIRDRFKQLGLSSGTADGSYFQPFTVTLEPDVVADKTRLILRGPQGQELQLALEKDFQPQALGGSGTVSAPIVFAGYGISAEEQKYDDYADLDVEGKIVLLIRREPQQNNPHSVFGGKDTTEHSYIRTKLDLARKHKAAGVLLVNDPFSTKKSDELAPPDLFGARSMKIPFAHVKQEVVEKLLKAAPLSAGDEKLDSLAAIEAKIDQDLKPISQPLAGWTAELQTEFITREVETVNVIGILEGKGPLAHEAIVVGAHYDHLGMGGFGSRQAALRAIHNGADDNASGTSGLMELALRFAERNSKPARTLVFIAFSGEERGLLGSNFYINHPVVPLKDTVAMFNYDMIGRMNEGKLTVYGVKTAKEFDKLVDAAAEGVPIKLDKVDGTMPNSDHYGFYQKDIPVFHFFTGLHKEYHTPDDTFVHVNVHGTADILDYTERLLDSVLELPKRPEFTKVASASKGPSQGGRMAYLGVVPDYASMNDGLRITGVNDESPAAKAGLKPNDVIIRIGEVEVTDIQGLADGLIKYKPGNKVVITVKRDGKTVDAEVTLGAPRSGN